MKQSGYLIRSCVRRFFYSITSGFHRTHKKVFSFFADPVTKPSRQVYTGLIIGMLVTACTVLMIFSVMRQNLEDTFVQDSDKSVNLIESRLENYSSVLHAVRGFFYPDLDISADEWGEFIRDILADSNYGGIHSLSFLSPKKSPGSNNFTQCTVQYHTALKGDKKPKTMDNTCQDNSVLKRLQESEKNKKIFFHQGQDKDFMDIYIPAFLNSVSYHDHKTIPLNGWVKVSIHLGDFFKRNISNSLAVYLYDENSRLIYKPTGDMTPYWLDFTYEKVIDMGGKKWIFFIRPNYDMKKYRIDSDILLIILIIGLFFSGMISSLIWSLSSTEKRAKAIADDISLHLKENENRLRNVLENIPGAVYRCYPDLNWQMEMLSDGIFDITGYCASDFLHNKRLYADFIHADDLTIVEGNIGLSPREKRSFAIEYRLIHKDGTIRWVYDRGQVTIDEHDHLPRLIGAIFDITEKKKSEEDIQNLSLALENAVEGIAFVDRGGIFQIVNDAFAAIFHNSTENLTGKKWTICVAQDEHAMVMNLMQTSADIERIPFVTRWQDKMGQDIHLELLVVPCHSFEDSQVTLKGFYVFARDITRRIQEAEALAHALDEAKTANKTKSEFLATMSHELRTPLNAIIGYSDLLIEEAADDGLDSIGKDLKKIKNAGHHLLELINDILDVSKLEAGKMTIHLEVFNVPDLAQSIVDMMKPAAEKNHNTLILNYPQNIESMYSDLMKVRQGLFNLLSNALKFTSGGTVTLTISDYKQNQKSYIRFDVTDTGCGILPEQLNKLFKPFSQADSSTTRKYGGTGLGLMITKRFCELLEGYVEVQSTIGIGSTFSIILPKVSPGGQKGLEFPTKVSAIS